MRAKGWKICRDIENFFCVCYNINGKRGRRTCFSHRTVIKGMGAEAGEAGQKVPSKFFFGGENHGRKSEKVFCGALAILSLTLFASCDPGHDYYDLEELKVRVERVELVDYENPDRRRFFSWVPDHSEDLVPLDMSRLEIIETLDGARVGSFPEDLSLCTILSKY